MALPRIAWPRTFTPTRLVGPVNLVLVAALAWTLAGLTWRLIPAQETVGALPTVAAHRDAGGVGKDAGLSVVAPLSLFGKAQAQAAAAEVPVEAPETRLNLQLRGVLASGDKPSSRAIIGAPGVEEKQYKVGDPLPGGASLEDVLPDRVILNRAGRFEALYLPKESMGGIDQAGWAPRSEAGTLDEGYSGIPDFRDGPPREPGAAAEEAAEAGERLQMYRERIVANPQEAFKLARVQPVMDSGKLKGYRLSPAQDAALFREMGLVPGDVVTSVNGVALSDPAGFNELMTQISTASQLNLTVERGGREENVVVSFGP